MHKALRPAKIRGLFQSFRLRLVAMRYVLPPLLALQAFEAAARHENFAAAAQELNLSQSAVSHRVRALERHLGYPLFERLPRGLRLTESAKAYLPSLRRAFEDILGSTSGVFGSHGESVLIVRAPVSYTSLWLSRVIDRFLVTYPHIEIRLTSSIWADKLAAGETDIDLRLGYGRWPSYEAEFLFRDPVVPVCSPSTATELGKAIRPDALAERPLVHVMGTEDHWAQLLSKLGVRRTAKKRDIRVDSSTTAAEIAATSERIALIQKRFADHYLRIGRLAAAFDYELEIDQALYVLLAETTERRKPEVTLFRDWLLDEYRQR
ncbi:MAG: LysR substrate-binding domain-containing protein [Gammaproteobacteria bacterium]